MKTVVITGSRGYLGRSLIDYYLREGCRVFALTSSFDKLEKDDLAKKNLHYLDIKEDITSLKLAIPGPIDGFFHFGWAGVRKEKRRDYKIQISNLEICEKMIVLASKLEARRFIFPGSISEYLLTKGSSKLFGKPSPQDAYGVAKVAARFLVQNLCEGHCLPYNYVLLTSLYSPERRDNNVITYVIKSLLRGESPKLSCSRQLWNFLNIQDAVAGMDAIINYGKPNEEYELGGQENLPLKDFLTIIQSKIDPTIPLGFGEIQDIVPDIDGSVNLAKLKKDTRFSPRITFEVGIDDMIDQFKAFSTSSRENN